AQTFVPIMANWIMKGHGKNGEVHTNLPAGETDTWDQKKHLLEGGHGKGGKMTGFERFRARFLRFSDRLMPYRQPILLLYVLLVCGGAWLLFANIGRDVLPKVNSGQFQVRLRAPEGTRVERTEEYVLKTLGALNDLVGKQNISITSAFVGQHPGQFSTSPI